MPAMTLKPPSRMSRIDNGASLYCSNHEATKTRRATTSEIRTICSDVSVTLIFLRQEMTMAIANAASRQMTRSSCEVAIVKIPKEKLDMGSIESVEMRVTSLIRSMAGFGYTPVREFADVPDSADSVIPIGRIAGDQVFWRHDRFSLAAMSRSIAGRTGCCRDVVHPARGRLCIECAIGFSDNDKGDGTQYAPIMMIAMNRSS
jgi:hypothetical protein